MIDDRPRSNRTSGLTARSLGTEVALIGIPTTGARRLADELRDAFCTAVDAGALAVVLHLESRGAAARLPPSLVAAMANVLDVRGGWLWLLTPRADGRLRLSPVAVETTDRDTSSDPCEGER